MYESACYQCDEARGKKERHADDDEYRDDGPEDIDDAFGTAMKKETHGVHCSICGRAIKKD
jgi:hypothetical protein